MVAINLKLYVWNYKNVWEVFINVKRVKSKYINEIDINYECLGLFLTVYRQNKRFLKIKDNISWGVNLQ